MIERYLEDLEARMNPEAEEDVLRQWKRFWNRELQTGYFEPTRRAVMPSRLDWPDVRINEAVLDDTFERMLLQQLGSVNAVISGTVGSVPQIRTNYGTAIMPSLFGVEMVLMDDALNTLPGTRSPHGGPGAINRLMDRPLPAADAADLTRRVLACGRYFMDRLRPYPKLSRYLRIYHPDTQGPFDICEVVWGSEVFMALYDEPDLVHRFMARICDVYEIFIDEWFRMVLPDPDYNPHYGWIHPGRVRLSLDSCMNLSPDQYNEFVRPCDERLLRRYGGVIHSCGKVDHFVPCLLGMEGYHAFNLSQPHMNDMEKIYRHTLDRNVPVLNLAKPVADEAVRSGRDLHGLAMVFP